LSIGVMCPCAGYGKHTACGFSAGGPIEPISDSGADGSACSELIKIVDGKQWLSAGSPLVGVAGTYFAS
jgi:hypothetical protein